MPFDVVLIRSNSLSNDSRVSKIVHCISKSYKVVVLGWDRERKHTSLEFPEKNVTLKRLRLRAPYNRLHLVLLYPLFWGWVFGNLLKYRPRIIHACDLDTLIPSYVFTTLFSTKLVFDSFDRYALAFIPTKYYPAHRLVDVIEELLASKADALITVSKERLSTFQNSRPECVEVIMNCAEDKLDTTKSVPIPNVPTQNDLTLAYAGAIAYRRGLLLLSEVIQNIEGVSLILAGMIFDSSISQLLLNPKIHYVGLLQHDEALKLQQSADIIPIFYDPAIPISRVANPNKLFEAMMLGVPVITNVCKNIVNEVGCGLVTEYDSNEIKNAILSLKRNPALRREMGVKGRLAFEKMYNWAMMEEKLLNLYHVMLFSKND